MKLSLLHEGLAGNLAKNFTGLFKKQEDIGRPELTGDPSARGDSTIRQPSRSGNQNSPIMKPRHKKFMNTPADGGSLESRSEQPTENDGLLNPGRTVKTERPTLNKF